VATRFHLVGALIHPWQQDSILLVLETAFGKLETCRHRKMNSSTRWKRAATEKVNFPTR
jgi:hypothetical protein